MNYEVGVKCMSCSLHFTIWTEEEKKHRAATIFCPECGTRGNKLVYKQEFKAPIFQKMPGAAMFADFHIHEKDETRRSPNR